MEEYIWEMNVKSKKLMSNKKLQKVNDWEQFSKSFILETEDKNIFISLRPFLNKKNGEVKFFITEAVDKFGTENILLKLNLKT